MERQRQEQLADIRRRHPDDPRFAILDAREAAALFERAREEVLLQLVATDGAARRLVELGFGDGEALDTADVVAVLAALTDFLRVNKLKADWKGIEEAPNEALVNALAMMSPYGPPEKQALLECGSLSERAGMMIAIIEMSVLDKRGGDTMARH